MRRRPRRNITCNVPPNQLIVMIVAHNYDTIPREEEGVEE